MLLPGGVAGISGERRILRRCNAGKEARGVVEACLLADRHRLERARRHRAFALDFARGAADVPEEELGLGRPHGHGRNDGSRKDRGQGARNVKHFG